MIDLNDLRAQPELYEAACKAKNIKFDMTAFLALDQEYRALKSEVENLRAEQNAFNKELPKLTGEAKTQKLAQMKDLAQQGKDRGAILVQKESEWRALGYKLPSLTLERVPVGKDDSENVEIRKVGEIRKFDFTAKSHVELASELDIIDFERGVKVAGARNYFLKGDGARLQRAVLSLALDLLHGKGYTIMDPPIIVGYDAMLGTGYFPGGEDQAYHLDERDDGFHLIGTAEVPVCAYHTDEIFSLNELPKKYAGISPCFRREAGTYGKDAQGAYRVHQFYKVEQVVMCVNSAEESAKLHAELLGNAEQLLQILQIPYRVVDVCTGDMGQGQVYKNDIESWMPSRNGYGETHSCSTFYEFQARRLAIRYKGADGKNHYCHTLNNTLVASPRILIPILELNQNADGSVTIPEALRPYMGNQEQIVKPVI
jgi:seryl-tRNA synthetase